MTTIRNNYIHYKHYKDAIFIFLVTEIVPTFTTENSLRLAPVAC